VCNIERGEIRDPAPDGSGIKVSIRDQRKELLMRSWVFSVLAAEIQPQMTGGK
jgi:hypothetical protein